MRPQIGRCRLADPNCAVRHFFVHRTMHAETLKTTSNLGPPSDRADRAEPFDRERLATLIAPIVASHGAELCDIELKNENGWVLRLSIERLGAQEKKLSTKDAAVDLEICSNVARDLSPALDLADPIPHRYHLEVGSPGVERPLRTAQDFGRFLGETAKLKLRTSVAGQKVLVGKLAALEGNVVTVQDGATSHPVSLDEVVSARLVFEFGPAPKPGPPRAPKKTAKRKK